MSPVPALGGDRRSGRIEAQRALVLGLLEERPDITILFNITPRKFLLSTAS